MIAWQAVREAASCFSPSTQQQQFFFFKKKKVPHGRRRVLLPRVQIAGLGNISSLVGPEKITCAHDPRHALQKKRRLGRPVDAKVGAERKPLNTEVIYNVNDLDAAPPEWRIGGVRSLAKTSAVPNNSITLGVAVGS